jgi:predicted nucleic-acid-binding Zn-ribbon protein
MLRYPELMSHLLNSSVKELNMNQHRLDEIIDVLNKKQINKPCPRCFSNNFSIIGEAEIQITKSFSPSGPAIGTMLGLSQHRTEALPIIIITCDNCGYVSQHAQVALNLTPLNSNMGLFGGLK